MDIREEGDDTESLLEEKKSESVFVNPLRVLITKSDSSDDENRDMRRQELEMKQTSPRERKSVDTNLSQFLNVQHSRQGSVQSSRSYGSLEEFDFAVERAEEEAVTSIRMRPDDLRKFLFTKHVYSRHPLKKVMSEEEFDKFIRGIWPYLSNTQTLASEDPSDYLKYPYSFISDAPGSIPCSIVFLTVFLLVFFVMLIIWAIPHRQSFNALLFTISALIAFIVSWVYDLPTKASRQKIQSFLDSCNRKYQKRGIVFSLEVPGQETLAQLRPQSPYIQKHEEIIVRFHES